MSELTSLLSTVNFSAPNGAIDDANGIIKGVVVISRGEAKGHGLIVDDVMLQQVCKAGQKSRNGVKCRFGHHGKNSSGLGSALGRFKNFTIDGDEARADLYLSEAAKKSPMGDLHSYVMALARSDSDLAGMSLAFEAAKPMIDDVGAKHCRLMHLSAIDLVDDPAAVSNGLFETGSENINLYQLTSQKELDLMANEAIKTELEKATSEIELSKKTITELTEKITTKDAEITALSAKSKEDADKNAAEMQTKTTELDSAKKTVEELSAKIAAAETALAKTSEELATFKKGAAPLSTKPADEVKKKSIFKNLS